MPAKILVCFSFSPLSSALIRPSHSITGCNYFKCSCSIRHCLLSTEHLGDFCGYWLASCSLRLKQECYYRFIRGRFLVPLEKWQLNVEVIEHFQVSVCLTKGEDLIEWVLTQVSLFFHRSKLTSIYLLPLTKILMNVEEKLENQY